MAIYRNTSACVNLLFLLTLVGGCQFTYGIVFSISKNGSLELSFERRGVFGKSSYDPCVSRAIIYDDEGVVVWKIVDRYPSDGACVTVRTLEYGRIPKGMTEVGSGLKIEEGRVYHTEVYSPAGVATGKFVYK